MSNYLFTSSRLGFREWKNSDLDAMAAICADKEVMEFFPSMLSKEQTVEFINTRQRKFAENGFCYYAVENLETSELIGFIGLSKQEYDAGFENPFVDIGWRLKKSSWFKGYATEGAKRCLEYGFKTLELKTIYAIAPSLNLKSYHVMDKVGMTKHSTFMHPSIADDSNLKECVAYKITLKNWMNMNTNIEVKETPKMEFAYISQIGIQGLSSAFERLMKWAAPKGLLSASDFKMATIYYDSFKVTAPDKVRMSVCILLNEPLETSGEVGLTTIEKGKCIVGSYEIEAHEFEKKWTGLFIWMNENGYQKSDGNPFEIYHNDFNTHPEKKCIVDLYIPVK